MPISDERYARYGKIHSALNALGWADEEYYSSLWGMFEVESKTELSLAELDAYIQFLRKRMVEKGLLEPTEVKWGWGANKYESLGHRPGYANPAQLRLVEATWREVARDESDEAMRKFFQNHVGIDHIIWLEQDDVRDVLIALKKMAEQEGVDLSIDVEKPDADGDVEGPSSADRAPREGRSQAPAADRIDLAEMTQKERVLWYLQRHDEITPAEAERELGIGRLAARIYDLRQDGHEIRTDERKVETRFGVSTVAHYSVVDETDNG